MVGVDRDNMTRVLCTGSDGFIGRSLVDDLDKLGMDVVCVDKHPRMNRTIQYDCSSRGFIKYLMNLDPFDFVFHLGSPCSVIQFNHDPVYCVENTLTGFRNTLRLAELWKAKFIYPSSGNVYGSQKLLHHERQWPKPVNLYGVCKRQCELMAMASDTSTIGLRIYAGYGHGEEKKNDVASVIYLFLQNVINGELPVIWGDGSQTRDFIYIDDIVRGLIRSMNVRGFQRIYNLGTGSSHSYNDVITIINEICGTDVNPVYIDKPKNYVNDARCDVSLMTSALNLHPRSLKMGISRFNEYLELQ